MEYSRYLYWESQISEWLLFASDLSVMLGHAGTHLGWHSKELSWIILIFFAFPKDSEKRRWSIFNWCGMLLAIWHFLCWKLQDHAPRSSTIHSAWSGWTHGAERKTVAESVLSTGRPHVACQHIASVGAGEWTLTDSTCVEKMGMFVLESISLDLDTLSQCALEAPIKHAAFVAEALHPCWFDSDWNFGHGCCSNAATWKMNRIDPKISQRITIWFDVFWMKVSF